MAAVTVSFRSGKRESSAELNKMQECVSLRFFRNMPLRVDCPGMWSNCSERQPISSMSLRFSLFLHVAVFFPFFICVSGL